MAICNSSLDDQFGPLVDSCRSEFDFTLLFEQSLLSIGPSVVFLMLAAFRPLQLSRRGEVINKSYLYYSKIVVAAGLICVQIANVISWALNIQHFKTRASLPASSLGLIDAIALLVLLHFEHFRSIRPSTIALLWLFLSMLFDIAQIRTLFLRSVGLRVAIIETLSVVLKAVLLILENSKKTDSLKESTVQPSQEQASGTFGRDFFWWLSGLLRKGCSSVLTVEDLDSVDVDVSSKPVHTSFIQTWKKHKESGKEKPLFRTILQSSGTYLLVPIIPRLLLSALKFAQPFLVANVVTWAGTKESSSNIGYGFIGAFAFVYIGLAVAMARYKHFAYRWVVQVRGNLVSLIYYKSMTLQYARSGDKAAVSLMSTDIERTVDGLANVHEIWASVIEVSIAIWLLERQVSYAVVGPVVVAVLSTFLITKIGPVARAKASIWAGMVENRVATTTDYLGNMRAFRIAGLGAIAAQGLQKLRIVEVAARLKFGNMGTLAIVTAYTVQIISPFLTFSTYSGIAIKEHEVLDSARLFSSLSVIALLTSPLLFILPLYFGMMAALASLDRIEKFCMSDDVEDGRTLLGDAANGARHSSQAITDMDSYHHLESKAEKSGCEKSSPTNLNPDEAIVVDQATFSWDKDPVVKNACFSINYSQLTIISGPNGSGKSSLLKALLGEVSLSNGSISLQSRDMAYCDQSPWLPNLTIQQCILGYNLFDAKLYSTVVYTCALDEDFESMDDGDKTKVGSKGATRVSGGQMHRIALARALYSKKRVYLLDDIFSALDNRTQRFVFERLFGPDGFFKRMNAAVVMVSTLSRHLSIADQVIHLKADGWLSVENRSQDPEVVSPVYFGDSNDDIAHKAYPFHPPPSSSLENSEESEQSRKIGDRAVYLYYAKSVGLYGCIIYVLLGITHIALTKLPEIWMQWWAASNEQHPNNNLGKWLGVFSIFVVTSLVTLAMWSLFFASHVTAVSSLSMHETLLQAVRKAPMSFFGKANSGETISRFSQDLSMIDNELSMALFNFVGEIYIISITIAFICISSGYAALTVPFVALALYLIQRFYLRTSKQMRILDLESKAPLYAHFTESTAGLVTIRAFDWTEASTSRNEDFLEYSQKPFYLLFAIQRWLGLVLDLVVAGVAVLTMGIAVRLHETVSPGWLGVALVNIITLSEDMNNFIVSWTKTEAAMGSIARIKAFSETVRSTISNKDESEPPVGWPTAGTLVYNSVSSSGDDREQPILQDISLSINAGEKIGICGRSGSGKSTLVGLLFRLMDPSKGSVLVDGVDLTSLDPEALRSRFAGAAQDSCVIPGTIRENLISTRSDDDLIPILQHFGLWESIESNGGLDSKLRDEIFSHGQKQLFCFIRTYLRESNVLALDEATSNMTEAMENLVTNAIQMHWRGRTVIAIAHRIRSIVGFDKILVLRDGRILEFDSPAHLLATESEFKKLYELERRSASSKLSEI